MDDEQRKILAAKLMQRTQLKLMNMSTTQRTINDPRSVPDNIILKLFPFLHFRLKAYFVRYRRFNDPATPEDLPMHKVAGKKD